MSELFCMPSPSGDGDGFISLSKTAQGRLFRKKILPMNDSFVHPVDKNTKIFVDKNFAQSLVDNFGKNITPVQVPVVNDKNQHVEDPLRNAGEVVDLDYDDSGVYATIDARKWADDFGKTILGASAFIHLNYSDTKTNEKLGPTLLHVAATNRPYIGQLGDYQEILKASADIEGEEVVLMRNEDGSPTETAQPEQSDSLETESVEEEITNTDEALSELPTEVEDGQMPTRDELIAALKDEHGIDVEALQAEAAKAAELSGQLATVSDQLQLSADSGIMAEDVAAAVLELSNTVSSQKSQIDSLLDSNQKFAEKAAASEVDGLIREGRILPRQRDVMIRLSMDDRDTFDALVPEEAIVSLSEQGVTVHENPNDDAERAAAIQRYAQMAQR